MGMQAEEIRLQSVKYERVQNLMHNINEQMLMAEHRKQSRRKAAGTDGVTKEEYDKNAEGNVYELMQRMRKFQYKPLPVKRVYIPKGNGKMRPLGLPSYEDKLVQGVMAKLLNDVYEVRFPEHDIDDKNFLRYIKQFLIGGIMERTELKESDKGTPQGGLISPVLANVYLHYVLDLWFEKGVKPRLRGEAYYVRYADDFLIMFQYEEEAQKVLRALKPRLGKFSLELAGEKTRILPIGRFKGTKEDFDFLGFTFSTQKPDCQSRI